MGREEYFGTMCVWNEAAALAANMVWIAATTSLLSWGFEAGTVIMYYVGQVK